MPLSPSNALLRVFEVIKIHSEKDVNNHEYQEYTCIIFIGCNGLIRQFHLDCCKRMALVLKTLASGNK